MQNSSIKKKNLKQGSRVKFGMVFSKLFEKKKGRKDKFFARIKGSIKYSRYGGYLQFRIYKRNGGMVN